MSDTRERFLSAIAECVPPERIVDVYLFPPMRQGGVEQGVAVIAALVAAPGAAVVAASGDDSFEPDVPDDDGSAARTRARVEARHTVFTARYRLSLKGPERGKWELDVVAQADAPLVMLQAVVRGVQDRAGDLASPERLTGEELRLARDGPLRQMAEISSVKLPR